MSLYFLFFLCVFVVQLHLFSLETCMLQRQQRHGNCTAAASSRATAAFSGISRASRTTTAPTQCLTPSNPPAISADKLQIVQFPPQIKMRVYSPSFSLLCIFSASQRFNCIVFVFKTSGSVAVVGLPSVLHQLH